MHSSDIKITIASDKDAALLTSLSITTFCETFLHNNKKEDMDKYVAEEMNEAKLRDELNDTNSIFLLAYYQGNIAGYAKIRTTKRPIGLDARKPLELERLYVLKEYHDKKTGAALMAYCIDHAINNRHDILWLGVWEHNHRAVSFYKRWGFEFFGSHIFTLGDDDQTDLLMKKQL